MIELPESATIGRQADRTLCGKRITAVYNATHLHKFTFWNGDPLAYPEMLVGKEVLSAYGQGAYVELVLSDNMFLSISDGINMSYGDSTATVPSAYQLLVTFDDNTFLSFTTRMYGCIYAFRDKFDSIYRTGSLEAVPPLSEEYTEQKFMRLIATQEKNITVKSLLATEQRIPGLGNGVLQDILFNARIHPRRKIQSLTDSDKSSLFRSMKTTLTAMTEAGGRDTETDLFGNKGGYITILSKNTFELPCPVCGDAIRKEAYLGGSVYYCMNCQKK